MRALALVALAVVASLAAVPPAVAGVSWHELRVDGLERSYRVYVPPGLDRSEPVAVVLAFHGFGQSVERLVESTGLDAQARRSGFVAVYPASVGPGWNAVGCCGNAVRTGIDDVGFVDALLVDLRRRLRIERDRVYATGISNGGMLTYVLGCRRAGTFAAIAPVAATLFPPCHPARPVSLLHVHGLEDPLVPFAGGRNLLGRWPPVSNGIATFRRADGCDAPEVSREGAVTRSASRCRNGAAVWLVTVADAGHQWQMPPLDTTRLVWWFLQAHPQR